MIACRNFCAIYPVSFQAVRYRHVPDPGTLEQRLLRAVTKPVLPPIKLSPFEKKLREEKVKKIEHDQNQYRKFLVGKAMEDFFKLLDHKMVLVFQLNFHYKHDFFQIKNKLYDKGMYFKGFPTSILRDAAVGTRYEIFTKHLLHSDMAHSFLFGDPTPENCKYVLEIARKTPFLILLGGLVEYRMMTVDQLIEFSSLSPDGLTLAFSRLLLLLDRCRGGILQNINHHQSSIVCGLKYYSS